MWKSFRNITDIPLQYYWQLIAYCYLYNVREAHLDYFLVPLHNALIENHVKYMTDSQRNNFLAYQQAIRDLPVVKRWKTFEVPKENIEKDIEFLIERVNLVEKYYNSLTYTECMNMNNGN